MMQIIFFSLIGELVKCKFVLITLRQHIFMVMTVVMVLYGGRKIIIMIEN